MFVLMFVLIVNEEDFDKNFYSVLLYNHNMLLAIHVNLMYEDFQIMDNWIENIYVWINIGKWYEYKINTSVN